MADERRQKAPFIAMQRPQSQASVFAATGEKPRVGREFHGVDGAGVAMQRGKQPFPAQVPQSYSSIQPAARNQLPVDAERHAPNAGGVTTQRGQQSPFGCRPHAHSFIRAATDQHLPIGRQGDVPHPACDAPQCRQAASAGRLRHLDAPSQPQVATRSPSALRLTSRTPLEWPRSVTSGKPDVVCHSRVVPSKLALASRRPSAETETPQIPFSWSLSVACN